jgi:hypothetical protein
MARGETSQKPRVTVAPVKQASGPPITNEMAPTPDAEPKKKRAEAHCAGRSRSGGLSVVAP